MSTSAFYTTDHVVEQNQENASAKESLILESITEIRTFFELDRCTKWINENGFQRVALQLPDTYLQNAYEIAMSLEKESGAKIYILADTSYRNCCIDDLAAEHAKCDSLIHFGEACLSAPSSLIPVLYIFGHQSIDFDHFAESLKGLLQEEVMNNRNVVVLYDACFSGCSSEIINVCRNVIPPETSIHEVKVVETTSCTDKDEKISLGRRIPELLELTANPILIYVASSNSPLITLWLMTYVRFESIISYDPSTKTIEKLRSSSHQMLRRRLFLVEKVRDANTIGLVVASTGVKGFREAIERMRELCKAAHKKLYVLFIGKINEAKLSNFATDIDVFVLLSCPFGVMLDANVFFKPVVSTFEAEIGLNNMKSWFSGEGWTSEFKNFLDDKIGEHIDNADVSLISGKIRSTQITYEKSDSDQNKQVIEYTAGDYFENRSWKGLREDDVDNEVDLSMRPGRQGIATNYTYQL